MSKIKVLPQDLVNKIAAGEVVERPASVVKELLDNAYDAEATQITIEIEEGGTKKILVVDDGHGMDREDLEMALQPHATSKLESMEDLLNISDYGFRGEALASISSVSKITLKSRTANEQLGAQLKVEGGQLVTNEETGSPVGTSVLIEDLFYNVPARKEFIKSVQSEYRAILDVVDSHVLANPSVGITFIKDGKTVYSYPKDQQLEDRARGLIGADSFEKMIPLFFEHPHVEVYGFIGKPESATERQRKQYIFVNKRRIQNKSISFSAKNAYGSLIPKNTYPPYIIFLDIEPNTVDINVHPRKEEVKFSNDKLIFDAIGNAVKGALDRTDLTPGADPKMNDPFGVPPFPKAKPFGTGFGKPSKPISSPPRFPPRTKPFGNSQPPMPPKRLTNQNQNAFNDPFWGGGSAFPADAPQMQMSDRKVYQLHNLYLIEETDSGIALYDQHAVHERILYEEFTNKQKTEQTEGNTQPLLTPVVINLSAQESDVLSEYLEDLKKAGFKIEEFGPNTYKIIEVPASLVERNIKDIVHELIEDLENDGKMKDLDNKTDKMLTYLACRSAYKAGDHIPQEELGVMIDKLEQMEVKYTCPHGRPVKVELTLKELSKMFKRT